MRSLGRELVKRGFKKSDERDTWHPLRELFDDLQEAGVKANLVGGAFEATELDAKRAIDQASKLAAVA